LQESLGQSEAQKKSFLLSEDSWTVQVFKYL